MTGFSKYFFILFLFCIQLLVAPALADGSGFLHTLEDKYFYDFETTRFGIEIEYTNVSIEESARIAQRVLGGKIIVSKTSENLDMRIIQGSKIGDLKIKVETNQTGETISDKSDWVYEIVGPPLTFKENLHLQEFLAQLKIAGARGSEGNQPVSIQTNTEVNFRGPSRPITDADVELEFMVMRNFYLNFDKIMEELSPVPSRLKYIQPISPGMLKRMKDPSYQPDAKHILDDYIYRQSLELSGNHQAWNLHITEVKKIIKKMGYPIIRRVVKLNPYRFSSMLMERFPNDPYFAEYLKYTWTFSAPITEQRARNNDFDLVSAMKQIVGLRNATIKHGLFLFNTHTGKIESLRAEIPSCRYLFAM